MGKKKIFFSITTAIVLFILFALSCAVATIVETAYGIDAAWAWIYKAHWFEAIQLLLGINLIYNLFKYKFFNIKKLPVMLFHLSFLCILLGSILTRYLGVEGTFHVRENDENNQFSTSLIYLQLSSKEDGKEVSNNLNKYITQTSNNNFKMKLKVDDDIATLTYKDMIPNGQLQWVDANGGIPIIKLVFSDEDNLKDIVLKRGDNIEAGDVSFTFDTAPKQKKYISFSLVDNQFFITTNQNISYTNINDFKKEEIELNVATPFNSLTLYTFEDWLNFSAKVLSTSAVQKIVSLPEKSMGNNAIIANLNYKNEDQEVYLLFGSTPRMFKVGGKDFKLAWSPLWVTLPFSLHLDSFKVDRYPGSNSPSGYSSDVVVIDGNKRVNHKIFMNNVLDYGGYRFFQSSYDQDEKGTILSVNKDPGKIPTYVGYLILCIGMFFNFFNPYSRFRKLSNFIDRNRVSNIVNNKTTSKACSMLFVALALCFSTNTLKADSSTQLNNPVINPQHVKNLASLVTQGFDGRMKPFDTVSKEYLSKIYGKYSFSDMDSNQVMLSIMTDPDYWRHIKIIKITDPGLKDFIGISRDSKYANFGDFFEKNDKGNVVYKLTKIADNVNRKPPGKRTKFDKDVLKVDERVNIFYMVFMGEAFKIVPKKDDLAHTWHSPVDAMNNFPLSEAEEVSILLENYFANVINAQHNNDWEKADKGLAEFKKYQREISADIIPSQSKIDFEILFNKVKIFQRLTPFYLLAGIFLLVVVFINMMKPHLKFDLTFKIIYAINILIFSVHTIGLALRWYVSDHAPWSNTYESLVYIAWALALSGIFFSKRSAISLSLTSILAGVTLFVAHLSMIDPQITPIQPVLNSYWLTIHVSVITASYGFLGLSSLLGMFTLILFSLYKKDKNDNILRNIKEATAINEMSMILGLCLLTTGNFLGGAWANESWGRYWGWDPKETWSLITILVYAAIVHFRFIPKLNSQWWLASFSMFAYASVIMTYFGVNFYLSGMHSYAAGDQIPVPNVVWITALVMIAIMLISLPKKKFSTKLN